MRSYLIKRILLIIPTFLVITFITYWLMTIAPGDPVKARYLSRGGDESTAAKETDGPSEAAELFKKRFHLDKPVPVGYYLWLKGILLHGDFGSSVTISLGTPVTELLAQRIPPTLKLNIISTAIIFLIAIPAGIYSAVFRDTITDKTMTLVFFILYSLPSFWIGLLLLMLISKIYPEWPTSGLSPEINGQMSYFKILALTCWHYILPVFCLSYGGFASLSRYARSGILEVIRQDYIRTARAKGCGKWRTILLHALRNGVIPIIVLMAGLIPGLIGGSVIIEYLFEIEGMGALALTALGSRDYPVIMTILAFSALLTLAGILLSDITLAIVDPRISYDSRK